MGNLSDRSLAVLAVLMELLEEKSEESGEHETQLVGADRLIADRLGYGSTNIVRGELGLLCASGRISKHTSPNQTVTVTLLEKSGAEPQLDEMTVLRQLYDGLCRDVQELAEDCDKLTTERDALLRKINTAGNRAEAAKRKLRESQEEFENRLGKLRKTLSDLKEEFEQYRKGKEREIDEFKRQLEEANAAREQNIEALQLPPSKAQEIRQLIDL